MVIYTRRDIACPEPYYVTCKTTSTGSIAMGAFQARVNEPLILDHHLHRAFNFSESSWTLNH